MYALQAGLGYFSKHHGVTPNSGYRGCQYNTHILPFGLNSKPDSQFLILSTFYDLLAKRARPTKISVRCHTHGKFKPRSPFVSARKQESWSPQSRVRIRKYLITTLVTTTYLPCCPSPVKIRVAISGLVSTTSWEAALSHRDKLQRTRSGLAVATVHAVRSLVFLERFLQFISSIICRMSSHSYGCSSRIAHATDDFGITDDHE